MVVKISESEAILIESRRSEGYDYSLSPIDEGLLIYRVDTKWTTGHGAFGLVLKKGITKPDLGDALVRLGESVTISGITITNMSKSDTYDIVTVT